MYKYIPGNPGKMTRQRLGQSPFGDTDFGDFMKQYFHGEKKNAPYFEGWYFKCQTREGHCLALIPAMHIDKNKGRSASIQVITEERSWYLEYPASSFAASRDALEIQIDKNRFSEAGVFLDIQRDGLSLHGSVNFGPFRGLRSDIMGPFRWLPHMECAHSVISMAHSLHGAFTLNGSLWDLDGGSGYVEADRGRSFPVEYLWTQCMWEACSLMLSIATIPFGKFGFTGCICAISLGGREHRLATYRGVKIDNWSAQGALLRQGKYRLQVELLDQKAQALRAPTEGNMNRTVHESLCARVRYRFWIQKRLVFDHISNHAGFEYGKEIIPEV
jgi:hypothetical protein